MKSLGNVHAFKVGSANNPQFPAWMFVPHGHRLQQLDFYLQGKLWEKFLNAARL